ncbi:hypothetical protein [Actinomadura macra]|uniref:hypothetical protein n=1 Tax=Actinomadura macra TaxID=46164 RepID=UPI000833C4B1|nr:hypothetical protein [Actinomadura macra]
MRLRITGKRLLPAALAAASILVMAAPASALQAPPDPLAHEQEDDCARALKVLSILRLLPNSPDVARTLCSTKESRELDEYNRDSDSSESGELFGLPNLPDLPESLTIKIPGLDKHPDAHPRGER